MLHMEARVLLNHFSTLNFETGSPTEAGAHQPDWSALMAQRSLSAPPHPTLRVQMHAASSGF